MKKNKVLILVPAPTARGGITNYYHVLKQELSKNIEYFERGARTWPIRKGAIPELYRAYQDYRAFKKRLSENDISLVQSTTSLGLSTIIRDGLFLHYANRKNIKTIAFFRGWDEEAEIKTEKQYLWLFRFLFFKSDCFIALSEKVKNKLVQWGYKKNIYIETTLVDKNLLDGINESFISKKFKDIEITKKINLLFLSRIEKRKGIYELLQAFSSLSHNENGPFELHLTICGDGAELENIRKVIEKKNLTNVSITGFVDGKLKQDVFKKAHLFVFPSYGEGMPNAVLEAMGFGLPILTTPVGGLVDFFIPGKHGDYITIKNDNDIYQKINLLINDRFKLLDMALNNYKLAAGDFRSDKVMKRMESIFSNILN